MCAGVEQSMAMESLAKAFISCCLLLLGGQTQALVGGAQLATDDTARSVIGIVGLRNSFCTATVVAPTLLLTAAHCVQPGSSYKAQYKGAGGVRNFSQVAAFERHPQFQIALATGPVADLALLELAEPLPSNIAIATLGLDAAPIWPGDHLTLIGEGITLQGLRDTGTNRVASLAVVGPYTGLQIRLIDTSGRQVTMGACSGDSGSPVFQTQSDGMKVVGVISWATSPNKTKGCGGISGATPLAPYIQWIKDTMSRLGALRLE
jgi:secreted trypsin-like serine protease